MLENNGLVSVIVPAHNAQEYIGKCLGSLISQTYENIEILVIENCSTDDTAGAVRAVADSRVRLIVSSEKGVSRARNKGIEEAKGRFIAFVDADDWVERDYIREAVGFLVERNLDLIVGATLRVSESGTKVLGTKCDTGVIVLEGDDRQEYFSQALANCSNRLGSCHAAANWCHLFTREVIGNHRFQLNVKYGEDTLFNVDVASDAQRIGVCACHWYNYRIHSSSAVFNLTAGGDNEVRAMYEALLRSGYVALYGKQFIQCKGLNAIYAVASRTCSAPGVTLGGAWGFARRLFGDGYWANAFADLHIEEIPLGTSRKILAKGIKRGSLLMVLFATYIFPKLKKG